MKTFDQLAVEFDGLLTAGSAYETPRPTEPSIRTINAHFGITLPQELVRFAKLSRNFGRWFASLGEDYTSPQHIIRINSYWRRRRRTRAIPKNLIIINIGFDDDLICIDVSALDPATGDYAVRYWSPGINEADSCRYRSFREYVEATVSFWGQ